MICGQLIKINRSTVFSYIPINNNHWGNSKENALTYTPTEIAAKDALQIESGKDTNSLGSTVQGDKVTAKIGGNLHIETLQEKKPTRRRTHRQASISRGIFARENSPSPRSAFP